MKRRLSKSIRIFVRREKEKLNRLGISEEEYKKKIAALYSGLKIAYSKETKKPSPSPVVESTE